MAIKKIELGWIVTSDLEKSRKFFVEALGLELKERAANCSWLEVGAKDCGGALIGVWQAPQPGPEKVGQNASRQKRF